MDQSQRIEMLERALIVVAASFSCDPEFTPEQQVATMEQIVRLSKVQALEDMKVLPKVDPQSL